MQELLRHFISHAPLDSECHMHTGPGGLVMSATDAAGGLHVLSVDRDGDAARGAYVEFCFRLGMTPPEL